MRRESECCVSLYTFGISVCNGVSHLLSSTQRDPVSHKLLVQLGQSSVAPPSRRSCFSILNPEEEDFFTLAGNQGTPVLDPTSREAFGDGLSSLSEPHQLPIRRQRSDTDTVVQSERHVRSQIESASMSGDPEDVAQW